MPKNPPPATVAPGRAQPVLAGLDLGPVPQDVEEEVAHPQAITRVELQPTYPRDAQAVVASVASVTLAPIDALEKRSKALQMISAIAIKATTPLDWTLYKDKDGRMVGVLRDSGAVNVRRWMQIRIFGHRNNPAPNAQGNSPEPRITEEVIELVERGGGEKPTGKKQTVLVAEMWCDAICDLTHEMVESVGIGLRSHDKYGKTDFVGRGHLQDLKASARTSLDTKCVRILSGLRKVDAVTLEQNGIDLARAYKGSGFGTGSDRAATAVTEGDVIAARKKLWDDIMRRVGGDSASATDVLKDITKWKGRDDKVMFAKSIDQLTRDFQVENAVKALAAHPAFGDKAMGAPNGRQPGEDDE